MNKILNEAGFETNIKLKSDKPFLGGEQLGELKDSIVIETDYEKRGLSDFRKNSRRDWCNSAFNGCSLSRSH